MNKLNDIGQNSSYNQLQNLNAMGIINSNGMLQTNNNLHSQNNNLISNIDHSDLYPNIYLTIVGSFR